jgi:lipoprotein-releasing system ATP-binding protein
MILRARDLTKSYHGVDVAPTQVLRGVSIGVETSQVISIMGPSGAGKSTLLHILGSLDLPDSGSVEILHDGQMVDVTSISAGRLAAVRSRTIGFVYQFHHLLPEFTALENVMMPARIAGQSVRQARSRAEELLARVDLQHRAGHLPTELSGGEQQRVAVARALMNSPALVLADEPTGNLDSANASHVSDLLIGLVREQGSACIIATHSAELAERTDRRLTMVDGTLSE